MILFLFSLLPSTLQFPVALFYFRREDKKELVELQSRLPKKAKLLIDNDLEGFIEPAELKVGDIIRLEPGDVTPTDALILSGSGYFEESAVGKQEVKSKGPGAKIFAASINKNGDILARVCQTFNNSKINRIIQWRKADLPRKKLLLFSLIFGLLPFCLARSSYQLMMAFLFSPPSAFLLGQLLPYRISRLRLRLQGVFLENEFEMKNVANMDVLLLDPYQSFLSSRPQLISILSAKDHWDENRILSHGFALARYEDNALCIAIVQTARERGLAVQLVENWKKEGNEISAIVDFTEFRMRYSVFEEKRALSLFQEGELCGTFVFRDQIRNDTKLVLDSLKTLGIATIAVTETPHSAVDALCSELQLEHIYAESSLSDTEALREKLKPLAVHSLVADGELRQIIKSVELLRKKQSIQVENFLFILCLLFVGAAIVHHSPSSLSLLLAYIIYQLSLFIPILNAMRLY